MIYHYTDLNAATSIVEKAEIWLTDYRYLNDKEEFSKGFEILCDALDRFDGFTEEHSEEFKVSLKAAVEFIKADNFSKLQRDYIFVASFSKSSDMLSQWRSYGMYCLELDDVFFSEDTAVVLECHYVKDSNEARRYANTLIANKIIPELNETWKKYKNLSVDFYLSAIMNIYSLSFKHSAFESEDEIRFVVSCAPDDKRIQFRTRGQLLIPYISIGFESNILKSVTVGPLDNQELAYISMNMFAKNISRIKWRDEQAFEYRLHVEKSHIPYRSI